MAEKDHTKHYSGLASSGAPETTPNTVSRNGLPAADRAFQAVVTQSGKAILDSELQLQQDAAWFEENLLRRHQLPSGWLRGQTHYDSYCDWVLGTVPANFFDDSDSVFAGSVGDSVGGYSVGASVGESIGTSVGASIGPDDVGMTPGGTLINAMILPRLEAVVAGRAVVVEFTNTRSPGYNLIDLDSPQIYDGTNTTVKRTDFVFLECWLALVAPSPKASGSVQVASIGDLVAGDVITINGSNLMAAAVAGAPDTFAIAVGNANATATNIADAINLVTNSFDLMVTARATLDTVVISAAAPGVGAAGAPNTGNFITLSVTVATVGAMVASGATLTGGADRPNKPADQSKVFRHGNTQSPSAVWLDDQIVDPIVDAETSQRVQLQYRIRSTGTAEAINHKKHPDGFSNLITGPPTVAAVFAQGGRDHAINTGAGDPRSFPFVPADKTSTWLASSAVAYDIEDAGLWIAGDGTEQSAQDLNTVDGFVYAIPIAFVFRHNNVSDSLAGFKGWDPVNNTNGAPRFNHPTYAGPLGNIPAGRSDRPDKQYCDVIDQNNILDLRRHVMFPGVDHASELKFQMQSVLDNTMRTWAIDMASKQTLGGDSGDVSTRPLVCNEIGRSLGQGGNPPTSGDTDRGVFIRNFDHLARRFGDQPVVERVVFAFYPGDRPSAGAQGGIVAPGTANGGKYVIKSESAPTVPKDAAGWYEGDTLHLDLEELNATTLGGIFQGTDGAGASGVGLLNPGFADFAPVGTVITDVLGAWHDDGHFTTSVNQNLQGTQIKGLGTQHLEIILDANDATVNGGDSGNPDNRMVGSDVGTPPVLTADGSQRRIFVEVEITYPVGVGTTDTPDYTITPDTTVYDGTGAGPGPIVETNTGQRPNDFEGLLAPQFRGGYREVKLEYVANDTISHVAGNANPGSAVGSVNVETLVSRNNTDLYFPRRVFGAASGPMANQTAVQDAVAVAAKTVDESTTEFGNSSRLVKLSGVPLSGAGQTLCNIEYFPVDPIPNYGVLGGGYQVATYFRTAAPQTAGTKEGDIITTGDGVLPTTLKVEPLIMSPNLWTGQVGMGSVDLGYPYESALEQIPINDAAGTIREWYFMATASVSIDDFDANTGLLALHPFVQGDVQNVLQFGGTGNTQKPKKDAEFRALYPYADVNTYKPTIISQVLSGHVRHKAFTPILARATETVPGVAGGFLFRKDEILLIVLSRFAELDDRNEVSFVEESTNNTTCAALYRTRNLLLSVGGKVC